MTNDNLTKYVRHPENAPGDFYSLGYLDGTTWLGECLQCLLPEIEAPTLLAKHDETNDQTYFVRQPETAEELAQAIKAVQVCCTEALRYAGRDEKIMRQLGARLADHYPSNWIDGECP